MKYQPSVFEWCSCRDNSSRGMKCKHIWSIEFAIRFGTLKDTDKLLADAKRDTSVLEPIPKLSSYKQLNYLPTVQDQDSSHPFFHTL